MSNLGGNSTSADTDKSNNLKGDKGDKGDTGAQGDQGDQGIQGETGPAGGTPTTTKGDVIARGASADERVAVGTDGQVLTADAASSGGVKWDDPAGGDPLTTKGDLLAYDTASKRLAVGTDDFVLTADSAAAEGVSWKAAAGGAAPTSAFENTGADPATGTSSSANATKGVWVTADTNVTVFDIAVGMRPLVNEDYHVFIAKEAVTAFEVDSIVATSVASGATAISMTLSGWMHYHFVTPFNLVAGDKYFIGVVRLDSTTTAPCRIQFPDGSRFPHPDFTMGEISVYANNVNPAVGFDIPDSGINNQMPVKISYKRT